MQEPSSPFADYRLVLTGHSLGAGAAILLGWILRTSFPNVRCCGFGTPASVLDRQSCLGKIARCINCHQFANRFCICMYR
jgi:putative lipase involved disintegration of autophagic bodies